MFLNHLSFILLVNQIFEIRQLKVLSVQIRKHYKLRMASVESSYVFIIVCKLKVLILKEQIQHDRVRFFFYLLRRNTYHIVMSKH